MSGLGGSIVSNCFFCGSSGRAGATCQACLVPIPRLDPDTGESYAGPRCAVPLLAIGIAPVRASRDPRRRSVRRKCRPFPSPQ